MFNSIIKRRLSTVLGKCKPLVESISLEKKYDIKILIPNIKRLNAYVSIDNKNYEIYGIVQNKLIDYYITNDIELDAKYVASIKKILQYTNLDNSDIYIYNTSYMNVSKENISRYDSKKRSRDLIEQDVKYQELIKDKFDYTITDEWVSASKTRNSALNDRCIDYYDEYNIFSFTDRPDKSKRVKREFPEPIQMRFKDGIDFEKKVVEYLTNKYKDEMVQICESYMARDKEMCIKTFKTMYIGTPIIYQGVLQNPENKTLGCVDLLIRDDFINEITKNTYEIKDCKSVFPHGHHYYVVDIKNKKLHFNVDNKTLRNNLSVKPFKYQLQVYNDALNYMQTEVDSEEVSKAFILGNGWKMEQTVQKTVVRKDSDDFIDKLGIIDFGGKDKNVVVETKDSIDWLQSLKKSTDWTHDPPSNKNIYPNMCNTNDDGYRGIKQASAEKLKDITLISYLTPEHRDKAFKEGIKTWDNPQLNANLLGINGKIADIVNSILDTNRDKSSQMVFYKSLESTENIMDDTKLEYYIDFETITHLNKNYVYMIGLGHVYDGSWNYSCFTLDNLDETSEREMYTKVMTHIEETNKKHKVSYKPLFYHWSSVEPYKMNKMIDELKLPSNTIRWYDLYKFFRDNLITVKGAYSHSLKSIGKGMFENKLIGTFWEGDILMDNKIHMIAYNYYNKNNRAEFNKLIDYNEVDCKIMYDILKVIRGLKK